MCGIVCMHIRVRVRPIYCLSKMLHAQLTQRVRAGLRATQIVQNILVWYAVHECVKPPHLKDDAKS